MNVNVTVIVRKEDPWYVATCVENNVTSQGKSMDEAIENLREALALYYEDNVPSDAYPPSFVTTLEVAI